MDEERIGTIEHYYPRVHAATVRLEGGDLRMGDLVHIVAPGVDIIERVTSLELDHRPIRSGHEGEVVGLLVSMPVGNRGTVFRIGDERHLLGD